MKPKKRAIGMRIGTLIFLVVFLWPSRICQAQDYFNNPVILGDMPDPSVVKIGDMFYATGTS